MSDWRDRALKRAAKRYGKPWKCGPVNYAREVLLAPGTLVVVKGNEEAEAPKLDATVSKLPRSKKA
mgnify:FL=1